MCEHFGYFRAVATEINVRKDIEFYTEKMDTRKNLLS